MENDSKNYAKRSAKFKRWLALYFIEKGNWKLTDKAVEEFGQDATPRQTMEFAEVYSDRGREERTEYRVGLTAKEKKRMAYTKIENMLDDGKAEELYDDGYIIKARSNWRDKKNRIAAIKKLVEILGEDLRDISKEKLEENGLWGVLYYYKNSPYKLLTELFPEENIKPWEMAMTPMGFYEDKNNRVAAIRWFVEKLGKDPRDITADDFNKNKLGGLFVKYYHSSPYDAVKEAFPEMGIKPWEMIKTSMGFYNSKENRVAATKWLVEKLKKDPRDLTYDDFKNNGLIGLLHHHYDNSPYEAVKEAFPEMGIKPWEMKITPQGFYQKKENRTAAVKWLAEKLKKDPRDITKEDFYSNRLGGLLVGYYSGSPYEAVKEAGLVSDAEERYMRSNLNLKYRSIPSSRESIEAARKIERKVEKKGDKPVRKKVIHNG